MTLSRLELGRQCMHIFVGLLIGLLYYFEILSSLSILLLIVVGVCASLISKRVDIPVIALFLNEFERTSVRRSFPGKGMIFLFIGALLSVELFPKDIAMASIMVLTFGDSVSHLFGARFGKIKNWISWDSAKLLEGTLAGAVAGFFGALFFVPIPEAFLGSFAAMFAEVVKIDFNEATLDDNLVVPLIAGTVMVLVRTFL